MKMADKELVRVTDLTYDDSNELVVTMVGRTKDGRRVVKDIYNTEPYMFVPEKAKSPNRLEDELRDKIIETRSGFQSYDGRRLIQIVTEYPSDVSDIRSEYPEEDRYETDIIYERRCTADYGLSGYVRVPKSQSIDISEVEDVDESKLDESISPRICIADIETEVPDVFTDDFAEEAPNKVQAITCYDSYDDEYTLFCLDAEHAVDPGEIRNHIEGHWEGDPDAVDKTDYTEAPITFKRFSTEKSLLKDYVHYIQEKRPDVVTGWNYVQFDHQYLVNRIGALSTNEFSQHSLSDIGGVGGWKIERFVPGMPAVDMMSAMQKIVYGERESWSLDYISHDVLGLGKVKGDENSYDENRSMFMAYNIVDVQLCVALNEAQGIMPFWYQIAEICSIPIYSVGSTMKECEGYLFKHRDQNEILPATDAESQKQAEGGLVLPPSDGVKDYVGVTDLKSLYPSSIITCNISKETMTYDRDEADIIVPDMPLNYEEVDDTITREDISWNLGEGNCVGFSLDTEGILPKYLKLLFSERERKKEMRSKHEPGTIEYEMYNYQQRAVKVIMNSFFGVSDNQYFRLSEEGLGDAITAASRFVQWYGVQKIEEQGYDVIYGDTDSLMLELVDSGEHVSEPSDVIETGLSLEETLNKRMSPIASEFGVPARHPYVDVSEMPHNLPDSENHLWQYEFEKLYRRFFQAGSKKRYAGWVVWDEGDDVDKIDTVGMESERSDTPSLAKSVQTNFIELVLKDNSFDELSEFIQQKVNGIENLSYGVDNIGKPSTINKPIEEYPNRPMPRAVEHINEYVDSYSWSVGDDPWLVYVDSSPDGQPVIDVIALPWTADTLPYGFELDVDKHIEMCLLQPIRPIIEEVEYTWAELKTGKKEQAVLTSNNDNSVSFDSGTDNSDVSFNDDKDESPVFDDADAPKTESSAFDWS
jgi:DNA polymerase elongation subunit (family B)